MPLDAYMKHVLSDVRKEERTQGVQFLSLSTGAGFNSLDAYRKQTYIETPSFYSGSLLLNPSSNKSDTAGGFFHQSDLVAVLGRDAKTTAESKDVKIIYSSITFRVSRVVDCPETDEIVVYANRLE